MLKSLLIIFGLSLASCATVTEVTSPTDIEMKVSSLDYISPESAVFEAAKDADNGVSGVFQMDVVNVGMNNGWAYLNSEMDYRDQRCLTVAISPKVIEELKIKHGSNWKKEFQNQKILVEGTAKRVKIILSHNGRPTSKYYYQTHVTINSPEEVSIQKS